MSLFLHCCAYICTDTQFQVSCSLSETPTSTTAATTTTPTPATASSVPTTDYFVTGIVTLSIFDPLIKVTALFSQQITCRSRLSLFPDSCGYGCRNTWLQVTFSFSETTTSTTAATTTTPTPATGTSVTTTDYFVTGIVTLSIFDPMIKLTAICSSQITFCSSMSLFPDFCGYACRNTWL